MAATSRKLQFSQLPAALSPPLNIHSYSKFKQNAFPEISLKKVFRTSLNLKSWLNPTLGFNQTAGLFSFPSESSPHSPPRSRRSDLHLERRDRILPRGNSKILAVQNMDMFNSPSGGSVLLWFKRDLRLDDHPGLVMSLSTQNVTPVYVFDPLIMEGMTDAYVTSLVAAVRSLRQSLRAIGSDLIVRIGSAPAVLVSLARELNATELITESEVETSWRQLANKVSEKLSTVTEEKEETIAFKTWEMNVYSWQENTPFPLNFREYQTKKGERISPLETPEKLPPLPPTISPGNIPTQGELAGSQKKKFGQEKKNTVKEGFDWQESEISPEKALDFFRGFLRIQEPVSRSDWQEFFFYVYEAEKTPLSSFPSLFEIQMSLGLLSRRRILKEIFDYEKARGGGWISPFGFSTITATSAQNSVEAHEFHEQMARRQVDSVTRHGLPVKYWRWKGHLVEYTACGDSGPPLVLIHGFGAFWDHYRAALKILAARNNRVFAVTLPGFGRSEKPRVGYTQYFWRDFVKDFVTSVVREPVLLAGNSIGGYIVASVAADWPEGVTNVTLFNSAGRIVQNPEPYDPSLALEKSNGPKVPGIVAWLLSRILFFYLQRNVSRILKRCYPKHPDRADDDLASEIIRASDDPGAKEVVEGAFYLPKPKPLNSLLLAYGGPVLVVQGKFDPLNDAVGRAKLLKASYPSATVTLVDAGHCPHDEIPEEVSLIVDEFVKMRKITDLVDAEKEGEAQISKLFAKSGKRESGVLDVLGEEASLALKDSENPKKL